MSRMIHGQTVTLIQKVQVGTDDFNAPKYEYQEIDVDNVLVSPISSDDVVNEVELYGKKAVFEMCIPKGDAHVWEGQQVRVYGSTWTIYTFPKEYQDDLVPLDWNRQYYIERTS